MGCEMFQILFAVFRCGIDMIEFYSLSALSSLDYLSIYLYKSVNYLINISIVYDGSLYYKSKHLQQQISQLIKWEPTVLHEQAHASMEWHAQLSSTYTIIEPNYILLQILTRKGLFNVPTINIYYILWHSKFVGASACSFSTGHHRK